MEKTSHFSKAFWGFNFTETEGLEEWTFQYNNSDRGPLKCFIQLLFE